MPAVHSGRGPARDRAPRVTRGARGGRRGPRATGQRLAGWRSQSPRRGPCGAWRARGAEPPRPAVARAARSAGPSGADHAARPELRVPAALRAARGGIRRRHVLRHVRDSRTTAGGRPRVRRHRVPARRRRGAVRRPVADDWRGGRGGAGRTGDVASFALPRVVRSSAGGDVHDRGRDARTGDGRADRRRRGAPTPGGGGGGARPRGCDGGERGPGERRRDSDRPRRCAGLRPADGRAAAPAPAARGHGRSSLARRLPRPSWLRRPAAGARDGAGGGHPGGDGFPPPGSRRGSVPDRSEVVRRRRAAGPAALRRVQRRRV